MFGNQCVLKKKCQYVPNRGPADRLITSKDHASVQIAIADVDADGRALNTSTTFALCGQVRSQGESDDSLNRLATKAGRKSLCLSSSEIVLISFMSRPKSSAMCGHTRSKMLDIVAAYSCIHCCRIHLSFVLLSRNLRCEIFSAR